MYVWYFVGLAIYAAVVLYLGYRTRVVTDPDEFETGMRQENLITTALPTLGVSLGAFVYTGYIGIGYDLGWSGSLLPIPPILAAWVFGMIVAPRIREHADASIAKGLKQATTAGDFFVNMYGEVIRIPVAVLTAFRDITVVGMELLGGSYILLHFLNIPQPVGIAILGVIILVYTWRGGFTSVNLTMLFQSGLIIIGSSLLLVLAGTVAGLQNFLPGSPALAPFLSNWGNWDLPLWQTAWLSYGLYYWLWFPYWQRIYAAKDSRVASIGFGYGQCLAGLFIWMSIPIGVALSTVYPGVADSSGVGPMFIAELPQMFPILGGVFAVILFTVIMGAAQSTSSGCTIAPTTTIGHDILLKRMNVTDSAARLRMEKYLLFVVIVGGLILAFSGLGVIDLLFFGNMINVAALFFPLFLGVFWPRVRSNKPAVMLSAVACPIVTAAIYLYSFYGLGQFGAIGQIHAVTIGFVLSGIIMFIGGLTAPATQAPTATAD